MTTPADLRAAAERVKRWLATPGVTPSAGRDIGACADAALLLAEAREERGALEMAYNLLIQHKWDDRAALIRRLSGGGPDA